ncbi:sensor histidine kinase [Streptomyces sp. NPDC058953]|uniref:sensor histidine kinase n=1 Tax=unclassified Streptomyces TaxID=2593676 RepID=UPI0036C8A2D0
MSAPPPSRTGRPPRPLPSPGAVLSWAGALAYPVLLYVVVVGERELTGMRLLPPLLLALLPLPLLRRHPTAVLGLMLAGAYTAMATATTRTPTGVFPAHGVPVVVPSAGPVSEFGYLQALLVDVVVGYIAAVRPRRTSITAAAAAFAVQIAAVALHQGTGTEIVVSNLLLLGLLLALAWTTGRMVGQRREHTETVRAQEAVAAVTAERLRIARELHDMVAHSIGIIAIQAGTGRRVIETQPAEARNALAAIETTSRDTLAGLRRMLGALREADPEGVPLTAAPGLADIDRLAAATRDGGVRVDVDWRGDRRELPADVELSAFRIIQEGITNVVRHAGTDTCRVVIDYRSCELAVEITDDGRGAMGTGTGTGTGYGITGMRERAALLHGRFTAGPREGGGFRVTAALPVPAEPVVRG